MGAALVELERLTKVYPGETPVRVLQDLDLRVDAGEILALRGPSGSGKSTLLNILGCLDRATSGRYRLGGVDVGGLDREELAWVRSTYIGLIFQSFHLLPQATALENVALPLYYDRTRRRPADADAALALERVGLADRARHFPAQLSGGERQRVAIARAVVARPRLLLADEPTGALDSRNGAEVMRLLGELHEERGTTIVLVTHDPAIAAFAGRQVFLRDGRIIAPGEVEHAAR